LPVQVGPISSGTLGSPRLRYTLRLAANHPGDHAITICGACGTENRPGRKFCASCGGSLALGCPACGAPNEAGERFCGECGSALPQTGAPTAAGTAPASPPPTSGFAQAAPIAQAATSERRLVSILFADLVGFTPFAEERDSEEVRETLTRYFDLATEVITRYGGIVEKFIGDAVMAVWGTPTAREDDAERAVRAALELVDAVRVVGPGISARAGVLTGEAAVTLGASNQGMVAGDLVNTAARLQSVAAPGTVLVGEATHRAASSAIAFEPAGEHTLKGKVAPVPAFRALRVVAERGGRRRSDTLEAPFVGRDDELRLLKDLYHATAREGRTRLVSITGIGGIGKSRLTWEFEKYLDGIVGLAWWHHGRSPAYGEGITFWALGEMIRGRAGLAETDDERTTRAKVAAMVGEHVPDEAERRWIEPALLSLLGVQTGTSAEQLFGAWRTFFERLAATGTVVLVFEDLHWADAGTLDFIDHMLEWSRAIPLYIVTLARPELIDRRPDWGTGRRNFTSLYLEPLPEEAMRALLAGLVPGLPEAAARAVVARAEGIPLYAVETVRMLVAEGKLTAAGDGTYTPTGDLATLAVPETLTALIAARLDGLDPADRSLVLDAAVLGQSFTPAGLAAVSGIDEPALEVRLRALIRRELFAHETDPRSPGRGQYAFVQALIREVAYNTLAKRDRKIRHLAAARYFESLETDEIAAALAGHYLAARDNAADGPEAEALGAQARISLRAAAERAALLGSHEQALALLEQALGVTNDPADRAELLERAGGAASAAGRHDAAERHLRAAIEAQRALGNRSAIARAIAALGRALLDAHRTPDTLAILEQASNEFADLAADPAVIALGGQLARALMLAGSHGRAIEVADPVLEAAEHADLVAIVADTLVTKGASLTSLSRAIEGLALIRGGQAVAESHGLNHTLLRAFVNRSVIDASRDPRAALEGIRPGLALARRLGDRSSTITLLSNGAEFAIRTGDWPWALAELEAALAEEPEPSDRVVMLGTVVAIRSMRGDSADLLAQMQADVGASTDPTLLMTLYSAAAFEAFAEGRLTEAREAWGRVAETSLANLPDAMGGRARAALWLSDLAEARADLAALDDSGVHGPALETGRSTIRAGIAALEGRSADALAFYRDALREWRDLGLVWDEALCGLDMAILLDPADPEVQAAADAAREILVGLEAAPFLARLDDAMARSGGAGSPVNALAERAIRR
jgi:class 3 adenylate cyclase/tetratricopeptide (TPR) repeat protein